MTEDLTHVFYDIFAVRPMIRESLSRIDSSIVVIHQNPKHIYYWKDGFSQIGVSEISSMTFLLKRDEEFYEIELRMDEENDGYLIVNGKGNVKFRISHIMKSDDVLKTIILYAIQKHKEKMLTQSKEKELTSQKNADSEVESKPNELKVKVEWLT